MARVVSTCVHTGWRRADARQGPCMGSYRRLPASIRGRRCFFSSSSLLPPGSSFRVSFATTFTAPGIIQLHAPTLPVISEALSQVSSSGALGFEACVPSDARFCPCTTSHHHHQCRPSAYDARTSPGTFLDLPPRQACLTTHSFPPAAALDPLQPARRLTLGHASTHGALPVTVQARQA